jgi:chemotaxis protein CheD
LAVPVGLGEVQVSTRTGKCLVAYGLGSCIAVCLHDASSGVSGMAHVVLPGVNPNGAPNGKFAGSVLSALHQQMKEQGAHSDLRRYVATLVGGAQVLAITNANGLPRMGDQNIQAVHAVLNAAGVRIRAEDLGGTRGRTVWLDPGEGGKVWVRTSGGEERYL